MDLVDLVHASREVSGTRARSAKVVRLASLVAGLTREEVSVAVGMLIGEPRQGRLGIGAALLARANTPPAAAPSLSLLMVDQVLSRIQATKGAGSVAERERALGELWQRATAEEQDFLVRFLLGDLRQGALEGVLLEAIARAAGVPASAVRRALLFAGGMAAVAEAALFEGEGGLSRFTLQLFRPLSPMLADSAAGLDEVMAEGSPFGLEHKLDGARIQVHRAGTDVRVFSRQGNDVTESVPEIVTAALAVPARELVLDGEAIVLSPAGRPEPFQTTMRRFGRRSEVAALQKDVPLSAFFFDCLQVDGQLLVDGSNEQRVAALAERVAREARVVRAVTADAEAARSFLEAALAAGHEGVLAKTLTSTYEAGRRGAGWRKIKPAQTLDLVVLAAEWGSGRRNGWLSNLHLGARDADTGALVMLGKTFKGLTDATLTWQTERLRELSVGQAGHVVHVRPELVVEIAFDGLQASSRYPGGLALRFARVKRYRPDKRAEDADTMTTVRAVYERSRTAAAEAGSEPADASE